MEKYRNKDLPVEERVEDLLDRMTFEEKIDQITCLVTIADDIPEFENYIPNGIGNVGAFTVADTVEPIVEYADKLQKYLVNHTRLGIPALIHCEASAGAQFTEADVFPSAIAQASTFDTEVVGEMTDIIRKQMYYVGFRQALSPVVDITRDPRWGRITETYGEDAALTSAMASAFVKGIQGDELKEGVLATAKHFAGHGITEGGLGREATDKELSGGVMCDGLGSSLAAVFGVLPNTSFSQNVGLVAMNKVVNRFSIATGGIFLIACGLFPKLAALISIMPQSVLGGAAVMMFSSIVVSGIQLITKWPVTPRNVTIVSVALGLGYGLGANSAVLAHMPQAITLIFGGSGIVPAALFAIILNIVLPPDEKSEVEIAEEILDMKKKEAQKK